MNKRSYKQFICGKGVPKSAKASKPMKWIPKSYIDTYSIATGNFRSRRKFGSNGWVYKDMDVADQHRPYDHVHDIKMRVRSKIPRLPNFIEKKELDKAKKKRRFL